MIPEPGSLSRWSASQPSRCAGLGRSSTANRSEARSSGPRSTNASPACPGLLPVLSCSATSSVTRWLAVAVVASTGVRSGSPARNVRSRR